MGSDGSPGPESNRNTHLKTLETISLKGHKQEIFKLWFFLISCKFEVMFTEQVLISVFETPWLTQQFKISRNSLLNTNY